MASTVPNCVAYDPAFAYELALIVQHGLQRMLGTAEEPAQDVFFYLTVMNQNHAQPSMPPGVEAGVLRGLYVLPNAPGAVALGEPDQQILAVLRQIQNDLFDAGADLSTPVVENPEHPPLRISQAYIDRLEKWCDEFNEGLAPLNSFILPGGTPIAALLHTARTVVRRAERAAWAAVEAHPDDTSVLPAKYLNRLSDLLFILSRATNPEGDVLWQPGGGAER